MQTPQLAFEDDGESVTPRHHVGRTLLGWTMTYIAVVFFSQALWRCRSVLKSISTFSASVAVNKQSFGNASLQAPHNLWRRL